MQYQHYRPTYHFHYSASMLYKGSGRQKRRWLQNIIRAKISVDPSNIPANEFHSFMLWSVHAYCTLQYGIHIAIPLIYLEGGLVTLYVSTVMCYY